MTISSSHCEDSLGNTTAIGNQHNISRHQHQQHRHRHRMVYNSLCSFVSPPKSNNLSAHTSTCEPYLDKSDSVLERMASMTLTTSNQHPTADEATNATTTTINQIYNGNTLNLVSPTCMARSANHHHRQHNCHHHHHNHRHSNNNNCKRRNQLFVNRNLHSTMARLSSRLLLLILGLMCLKASQQTVRFALAANAPDQMPIFGSSGQFASSLGPTLCPLVPACQCKWSNGKQAATCERRNLANIPSQLSPDTQVLEMRGNNLNQLTPHIFQDKHLTNLQKIFLPECKISYIANEAFAHLTNLIELDLSQNNIQQVPVKSFEQLNHSLRRLILAFNPIQVIETEAFSSLTQLDFLDLSNCQLSQLKQGAFHGLKQLKELKLHDNRLTQLPMNVLFDLNKEYLIVDLFTNPWHCDCELRQSIDWMSRHHIQQSIDPTCGSPQRHKDIRWQSVKSEEFICPPVVINKQNELTVGAGSNVSLSCTARGSPPLTFVWFQDEKNLTTARSNQTEPPSTTKLLDEKRYEIAEEVGPPGLPNITTSILYLFNLKLTDTSLFLCWVENAAGYTIANFSLIVNDSPPATLTGGSTSSDSMFRIFGLSQGEAQMGIVSIIFVILIVAVILFLLMFKRGSRSSKSSQSSDLKSNSKKSMADSQHAISGTLSAANKFSSASAGNQRSAMLADSEEDCDESDDRSSAGSGFSCRKGAKVIPTGELDGFIEHMRSGIINMDYHSMSPVIQFNNTLKSNNNQQQQHQQQQATAAAAAAAVQLRQQQQNHMNQQLQQQQQQHHLPPYLDTNQTAMHHFPSGSNASSLPYYTAGGGNGSASMATTTSDLSPSSGSGASNTNFANNGPLTNCDLQHQMHQHQHQHQQHQQNDLTLTAPPTNTTATSYTSDYQSGYGEDPATSIVVPPMYPYEQQLHNHHHHHHQAAFQQQQYQAQMAAAKRGQGPIMNPAGLHQQQDEQQQAGGLVMQDMMMQAGNNRGQQQSQASQQQQHLRMDSSGFQYL